MTQILTLSGDSITNFNKHALIVLQQVYIISDVLTYTVDNYKIISELTKLPNDITKIISSYENIIMNVDYTIHKTHEDDGQYRMLGGSDYLGITIDCKELLNMKYTILYYLK